MGTLSNLLNPLSSSRIVTINQLLEEKPDGFVTICGFEIRDGKYGASPVFKIKELGGLRFWAGGKLLKEQLVPKMQEEFGSTTAIDAAFQAEPQLWKIGQVITLKNGHRFRPIEFLGDAPAGMEFEKRNVVVSDTEVPDEEV